MVDCIGHEWCFTEKALRISSVRSVGSTSSSLKLWPLLLRLVLPAARNVSRNKSECISMLRFASWEVHRRPDRADKSVASDHERREPCPAACRPANGSSDVL